MSKFMRNANEQVDVHLLNISYGGVLEHISEAGVLLCVDCSFEMRNLVVRHNVHLYKYEAQVGFIRDKILK